MSGEIGFVLLVVAVVAVPAWLCRAAGNRIKERLAPVPAKSTKVVLSADPTPPAPSLLSQVVIRTGPGSGRLGVSTQASGCGLNTHVKDVAHGGHGHHDYSGHGHGHGDGHC